MNRNNLIYFLSISALLSLGLISCSGRSTPPGPDMAGGVHEHAGYQYYDWQEGLDILIWHNAIANVSCNSSGSTEDDTYLAQCQATSESDNTFSWQIETTDGRTAQMSIANQLFDLADGTVFLVTTADGQTNIQQLQRSLSGVDANNQNITQFSLADPDISRFIQSIPPEN